MCVCPTCVRIYTPVYYLDMGFRWLSLGFKPCGLNPLGGERGAPEIGKRRWRGHRWPMS